LLTDVSRELFRCNEVDSTCFTPVGRVCFNIFSSDVIHSFGIPSLGVKVDAVPGKCNSIEVNILSPGDFYGSCYEICGVNHSFIPFIIRAFDLNQFEVPNKCFIDRIFTFNLISSSPNVFKVSIIDLYQREALRFLRIADSCKTKADNLIKESYDLFTLAAEKKTESESIIKRAVSLKQDALLLFETIRTIINK
jgi:hypothetical protein